MFFHISGYDKTKSLSDLVMGWNRMICKSFANISQISSGVEFGHHCLHLSKELINPVLMLYNHKNLHKIDCFLLF